MGLFSNTSVDKGIASLFGKKITKNDLIPKMNLSGQTEAGSTSQHDDGPVNSAESGETQSPADKQHHEDLEDAYVRKAALAEDKHTQKKRDRTEESEIEESEGESGSEEEVDSADLDKPEPSTENTKPDNEQKTKQGQPPDNTDLERTLFVKNVPYSAMTDRKVHKAFKAAFGPGIKSIRFRSIALSEIVPRKVGFIKQKLNTTRDAVNSYIVYDSVDRVKEALRTMNNFEFEDHHLFVDSAAKPRSQATKRSVFIGNLSFDATEEQLYRMFADVGKIENLRIVRDRKFNIGKGFAYIQFEDVSTVQLALMKNDQEFDGRKLRVVRCSKNATSTQGDAKPKKSEKAFKQKQTKRSQGGKPQKETSKRDKSSNTDKPRLILEGERSKPGDVPQLGRKRKPRHENGRSKRVRKNK